MTYHPISADRQAVQVQLFEGAHWLTLKQATDITGILTQAWRTYVHAGCLRARRQRPYILLLRDDVWQVYLHRAGAHNKRTITPPQTLVEKGLFPPTCSGMTGEQLTQWAQDHEPPLLASQMITPAALLRPAHKPAAPAPMSKELAQLEERLARQERLVLALLNMQGHVPSHDLLSDPQIESMLRGMRDAALSRKTPDVQLWLRTLGGLRNEHMAQFAQWASRHPQNPVEPPGGAPVYVWAEAAARRLRDQTQNLPGALLTGSINNTLHRGAQKVWEQTMSLVQLQIAADITLRATAHDGIPAPLTALDQAMLGFMVPSLRRT